MTEKRTFFVKKIALIFSFLCDWCLMSFECRFGAGIPRSTCLFNVAGSETGPAQDGAPLGGPGRRFVSRYSASGRGSESGAKLYTRSSTTAFRLAAHIRIALYGRDRQTYGPAPGSNAGTDHYWLVFSPQWRGIIFNPCLIIIINFFTFFFKTI